MKLSTGRSIMIIIIILIIIKLTEAWPLSIKKKDAEYVCSRSVRNNNIKRVSAENSMIAAQVLRELQDLTQTYFSR